MSHVIKYYTSVHKECSFKLDFFNMHYDTVAYWWQNAEPWHKYGKK